MKKNILRNEIKNQKDINSPKKRTKDINVNVVGIPTSNVSVNKPPAKGQSDGKYQLYKISIDTKRDRKQNSTKLPSQMSKPRTRRPHHRPANFNRSSSSGSDYTTPLSPSKQPEACLPGKSNNGIRILGNVPVNEGYPSDTRQMIRDDQRDLTTYPKKIDLLDNWDELRDGFGNKYNKNTEPNEYYSSLDFPKNFSPRITNSSDQENMPKSNVIKDEVRYPPSTMENPRSIIGTNKSDQDHAKLILPSQSPINNTSQEGRNLPTNVDNIVDPVDIQNAKHIPVDNREGKQILSFVHAGTDTSDIPTYKYGVKSKKPAEIGKMKSYSQKSGEGASVKTDDLGLTIPGFKDAFNFSTSRPESTLDGLPTSQEIILNVNSLNSGSTSIIQDKQIEGHDSPKLILSSNKPLYHGPESLEPERTVTDPNKHSPTKIQFDHSPVRSQLSQHLSGIEKPLYSKPPSSASVNTHLGPQPSQPLSRSDKLFYTRPQSIGSEQTLLGLQSIDPFSQSDKSSYSGPKNIEPETTNLRTEPNQSLSRSYTPFYSKPQFSGPENTASGPQSTQPYSRNDKSSYSGPNNIEPEITYFGPHSNKTISGSDKPLYSVLQTNRPETTLDPTKALSGSDKSFYSRPQSIEPEPQPSQLLSPSDYASFYPRPQIIGPKIAPIKQQSSKSLSRSDKSFYSRPKTLRPKISSQGQQPSKPLARIDNVSYAGSTSTGTKALVAETQSTQSRSTDKPIQNYPSQKAETSAETSSSRSLTKEKPSKFSSSFVNRFKTPSKKSSKQNLKDNNTSSPKPSKFLVSSVPKPFLKNNFGSVGLLSSTHSESAPLKKGTNYEEPSKPLFDKQHSNLVESDEYHFTPNANELIRPEDDKGTLNNNASIKIANSKQPIDTLDIQQTHKREIKEPVDEKFDKIKVNKDKQSLDYYNKLSNLFDRERKITSHENTKQLDPNSNKADEIRNEEVKFQITDKIDNVTPSILKLNSVPYSKERIDGIVENDRNSKTEKLRDSDHNSPEDQESWFKPDDIIKPNFDTNVMAYPGYVDDKSPFNYKQQPSEQSFKMSPNSSPKNPVSTTGIKSSSYYEDMDNLLGNIDDRKELSASEYSTSKPPGISESLHLNNSDVRQSRKNAPKVETIKEEEIPFDGLTEVDNNKSFHSDKSKLRTSKDNILTIDSTKKDEMSFDRSNSDDHYSKKVINANNCDNQRNSDQSSERTKDSPHLSVIDENYLGLTPEKDHRPYFGTNIQAYPGHVSSLMPFAYTNNENSSQKSNCSSHTNVLKRDTIEDVYDADVENNYALADPTDIIKKTKKTSPAKERSYKRASKRKVSTTNKALIKSGLPFAPREELIYVGRIPNTTYNVFFSPDAPEPMDAKDTTPHKERTPRQKNEVNMNKRKQKKSLSPVRSEKLLHQGPKGILIFVNKKSDNNKNPFDQASSLSTYKNRRYKSSKEGSGSIESSRSEKYQDHKKTIFNMSDKEIEVERSSSGTKITYKYPCGCIRIITADPDNSEILGEEIISALCSKGSQCEVTHPEVQKADTIIRLYSSSLKSSSTEPSYSKPSTFSEYGEYSEYKPFIAPKPKHIPIEPFPGIEVIADGIISKKPIPPRKPAPTMRGASLTGSITVRSNRLNGVCNIYLDDRLKNYLRKNLYSLSDYLDERRQRSLNQ